MHQTLDIFAKLSYPTHLVHMVDLEVLKHEQQNGRYRLDQDLLVAIRVYPELDRQEVRAEQILRKQIRHDLQRVGFGPRLRHRRQQNLEQADQVLRQLAQQAAEENLSGGLL